MQFDVIVFDFDGTLVETAGVKRDAFFAIFPDNCAGVVEEVLAGNPDGSRYEVIPAMLEKASASEIDTGALDAENLLQAYAAQVALGVKSADIIPGASKVLNWAADNAAPYVFSVTPHDELVGELNRRGWSKWLRAAYGFPNHKPEILKLLLDRHDCSPQRLLVVGDGTSDEHAANTNQCRFMKATDGWPSKLMKELVENHD